MSKLKNKTLKLGLTCLLIGIGITGSLVGCNGTSGATTTAEVTTAAPTTEAPPVVAELPLGETATLGTWKFKVNSFKSSSEIENGSMVFKPRGDGKKFVIVNITVKNTSKEDAKFLKSLSFEGKDVLPQMLYQGTEEIQGTRLLSYSKDLIDKTIDGSSKFSGILVFEVEKDVAKSGELSLQFSLGKETVSYALKK